MEPTAGAAEARPIYRDPRSDSGRRLLDTGQAAAYGEADLRAGSFSARPSYQSVDARLVAWFIVRGTILSALGRSGAAPDRRRRVRCRGRALAAPVRSGCGLDCSRPAAAGQRDQRAGPRSRSRVTLSTE